MKDYIMMITRTSPISGQVRTRDIPVNPQDYAEFEAGYGSASELMPYLNSVDIDFIIGGITPNEWKAAFSEEIMAITSDTFA
jgi:ABC-type amino acid transport substrate-binding protein